MKRLVPSIGAALLALGALAPIAAGAAFTNWGPAINVESLPGTDPDFNTAASDGCPAETRDGLRLFMASTRAGGFGGIDIWVASRDSADAPWGAPVNAGPVINTGANEFCPSPTRDGKGFMFVSNRAGGCGGDDIYVTRFHHRDGGLEPVNPGCSVNSAGNEASPFRLEDEAGGTWLYFSSTRAGGVSQEAPGVLTGDADLYVAAIDEDGSMGTPALVPGASSAANDARPNVRRDGLELFFDSDRAGGFGGFDIWSADRRAPGDAWSAPSNLGSSVNSAVNETRPWLSWDRTVLYFGAVRGEGGSQDIFATTRSKG
jgi:Tol biopolymer transport system component